MIKLGVPMAGTKCTYGSWCKTTFHSKSPFIVVNMPLPYMVLFTPVYQPVYKLQNIDEKSIRQPFTAEEMLTYMLFRMPNTVLKCHTNRRGSTTLHSKG
jgi:hypothetical protein